jgi:MFS family permease
MRRARAAVATLFFILGAGFGSWAVRIPDVQHRLHLSAGALGSCLLAVALGSMVGMPAADLLGARVDSARAAPAAAIGFAAALGLAAAAPGLATLLIALLLLGFGNGMLSVQMNSQGVRLERHRGRPVMAACYAACSVGGLVGSVTASLAAEARIAPAVHLAVVAGILAALAVCADPFLIAGPAAPALGGGFLLPRVGAAALPLGLLAFCDQFCEGTVADWSTVYLHNAVHVRAALAGIGYAAFVIAMAGGRLAGDALSSRFGPRRLVRAAGALAFAGACTSLLGRTLLPVAGGFAVLGLGLSAVFPRAVSAAGRRGGGHSESAVAAVSTIGYSGFLVGPPLVGYAAQFTSLSLAMAVMLQCSIGIMLLSRVLPVAEYGGARAVEPGGALGRRWTMSRAAQGARASQKPEDRYAREPTESA